MLVRDGVVLQDAKTDNEGYLHAFARTARTGIQEYLGAEVGRPDLRVVRVYRDEAEVFSKTSLETFSKLPVTVGHPRQPVNAKNWRDLAVGTTGEEVLRDGEYLRIGFKIFDGNAVKAVADGKRELSVGYSCELDWTGGTTADGQSYDAKQVGIVANHIAIVDKGRAGAACRLADGWQAFDDSSITGNRKMKTIVVDGVSVEMEDTAAQVVEKFQRDAAAQLADAKASADKLAGELAAVRTELTAQMEAKDGEIAVLKAAQLSDEQIEQAAVARADLIAKAKSVLGDGFDGKGKSSAEIRKAVVEKKLGDAARDMSDAAIEGAFAALAISKADPQKAALKQNDAMPDASKAYDEYVARLRTAYKGGAK